MDKAHSFAFKNLTGWVPAPCLPILELAPQTSKFYPVQVCHLSSSYLVENKRPASILPGTKRRSDKDRRPEGVRSVGRPKDLSSHHSPNQLLIATEINRNGPKSLKISAGVRSNRNKTDDPMRIGTLRESARLDDRRISLLTTRLINF